MYATATAADTLSAPSACVRAPAARGDDLLGIDAGEFGECFDRRPFVIGHRLADHPLFSLPRLVKLARALPAENVEYNAGNIPVSMNPALTPRNGLTAEETIIRIAECKSWLVLKYVEHDPEYRKLLERCLAEVRPHSEALRPGMCDGQAFVFITSPGSVTPYHMDPEHNFLLQVRGSKHVHLFDPRDRSILPAEELERFYGGGHRNMVFRRELDARALRYELTPGRGLHFPVTAPHYVRNGAEVSVSFSITFRTPDLERRARAHLFNARLRRLGISPASVGRRPRLDSMKSLAWRVSSRIVRALRR
jgi:hypothetical protein